MKRRVFLAHAAWLGLSACTLGRSSDVEPAYYDLGIEPIPGIGVRLSRSLALEEVSATAWLQTQAILYRLAYRDAARLQAYAHSRWTASPAVLLTQRLRLALGGVAERGLTVAADGVPSDLVLRTELDAFEQTVRSSTSSRALVRLTASLMDGATRTLRAQRSFSIDEQCPSVDAAGAVRGLRQATDRLVVELSEWLAVAMRG